MPYSIFRLLKQMDGHSSVLAAVHVLAVAPSITSRRCQITVSLVHSIRVSAPAPK